MKYQRIAYQGSFHHPVGGKFEMTTKGTFEPIVQSFKQRTSKIAVDYNHQMESASGSADDKIAAGWIDDLTIMNGDLYAAISWTEQAKKRIESQEYRYVSPAIIFDGLDNTGKKIPARLSTLGLVNKPFLSLLDPVQASDGSIAVCCNEISAAEIADLDTEHAEELVTLYDLNAAVLQATEPLTLQLSEAQIERDVAAAQVAALKNELKLMHDAAIDARIDEAFVNFRQQKNLTPNSKKMMRVLLQHEPETFEKEYPRLGNAPGYLMRQLSADPGSVSAIAGFREVPHFSVILSDVKTKNPTLDFDSQFTLALAEQATLMGAAA